MKAAQDPESGAWPAERARWIADAIHSVEMERLPVSADGREDAAEYVAGHIDADELVARARSRHGLS